MKKLLVFILTICMAVPFVTMKADAAESESGATVNIESDSVLVLTTEDESIDDIELTIPTSLEYQEVLVPFGTDLSNVKFTISLDKMHFSMDEDVMEAYDIPSEYLAGYFMRMCEDYLKKDGITYAKDGGDYEVIPEGGLTLEEGATYTFNLDGVYRVRRESIYDFGTLDREDKRRNLQISQSCKFAFSVSEEDPAILEGATYEMVEGTDTPLTIKVDNDFAKFQGVECDGVLLVKDTDYVASSGSTVVTLSADFMKQLAVGEHKVKILFADDVSATSTVVVTKKATQSSTTEQETSNTETPQTEAPKTGDYSLTGMMMVLLIGATVSMGVVSKKRKYN